MSSIRDQACQAAVARHPDQPRSHEDKLARLLNQLADIEPYRPLSCSGKVHIGMFFDGTGNNKDVDYDNVPRVEERKHSNVVRLFHVYPESVGNGTDAYFRYYAPGVGTLFNDVGDLGGLLGKGFAAMGQARITWGLTRVFNAISRYIFGADLISDDMAKDIALERVTIPINLKGYWQQQLVQKIAYHRNRPKIDRIVVDVFGFSRGAAQARAWVRQLYALCEKSGDDYLFAGRPLQVRFMGLFDTVASVGGAGLMAGTSLLDLEGHMGWAHRGLQIPPQVGHCLHYVALHEVRGSFPSDSVRVGHDYPANCREVVYPGSHSDVGGGYQPGAQGKTDQLARIPGFAMYEAACDKGVPFLARHQLTGDGQVYWKALAPNEDTVRDFDAYQRAADVGSVNVLEAHRAHMALYFRYRMHAGLRYGERSFMAEARRQTLTTDLALRARKQAELSNLVKTQRDLLDAARTVALMAWQDDERRGPRTLRLGRTTRAETRARWLVYATMFPEHAPPPEPTLAKALARWRERLAAERAAELLSEPLDLDLLTVADALCGPRVAPVIESFFDDYVHDSMAGFIGDGADEYQLNGHGLFKHRRFYVGDAGDAYERRRVREENARRIEAMQPKAQATTSSSSATPMRGRAS